MADVHSILITDVGSTTTKALLIEDTGAGGQYRLKARGSAPTTVEAPHEDVVIGLRNSVAEIEDLIGKRLLDDSGSILFRKKGNEKERDPGVSEAGADTAGVDLFLSTSSAGGGLQIAVCGVAQGVTGRSARRAALGAGAVILEVLTADDGRALFEKMDLIKGLRPDMFLLSGGTDGGNTDFALELCDLINAARPKSRLGEDYKIPVVFAGNVDARPLVRDTLNPKATSLHCVDNIRPTLNREVLGPTRRAIRELFMSHVMSQAPGYRGLARLTSADIIPTPTAVGQMMEEIARRRGSDVLGVDIGGATTDVFSVFSGRFDRSVSANLGMSYSAGYVLDQAGVSNVARWLPFDITPGALKDQIFTKMVYPTSIPQTLGQLLIEQALAREALRLALEQHRSVAVQVREEQTRLQQALSSADSVYTSNLEGASVVDMAAVGLLIGSGGVLSHAPNRGQAALMMLDALQPVGFTELAVDSIFMLPHLGVLANLYPAISWEVFEKDCFIPLGTAIAPRGKVSYGRGLAIRATVRYDDGRVQEVSLKGGQLKVLPLAPNEVASVTVRPERGLDIGAGSGRGVEGEVRGGLIGIILDVRGRPIAVPEPPWRQQWLYETLVAAGAFGREQLTPLLGGSRAGGSMNQEVSASASNQD